MDRLLEGGEGVWRDLTQGVRRLRELERTLGRCLRAAPERAAVRVAAFERGRLVLVTDSPVWCSRLRYESPALRACLARSGVSVAQIELRVAPTRASAAPSAASGTRRARLSGDSARLLRSHARGVRDPALRAALERLAGRHRDSSGE